MNHSEKAVENFKTGCNCAQSVFVAFTDVTGLDRETAMKFASGFGGGIGGMKEVCGVLTGAFMVLGAVKGFTDTSTKEEKDALSGTIKAFADEFRSQYGSMMCRDLVETSKEESFLGEKAQDDFFVSKPCAVYVEQAAAMLDRYLTD